MNIDRISAEMHPNLIEAIMAYNRAHRLQTHCVVVPPESKIGGFSGTLVEFNAKVAVVRIANGDLEVYPRALVFLNLEYL